MKKLIIIIVFLFLISLLISFNYLLWDREKQLENLQGLRESKNITIDTLSDKMNNLDKLNKELTAKVEEYSRNNELLKENSLSLTTKNAELEQEIIAKNNLISLFKKNIDISQMNAVIAKWADAINSRNYKTAQTFISANANDEILSNVEKHKEIFQKEIKTIKLKSSVLFTELTDEEHLAKIQFKVNFEVDRAEVNGTNAVFKKGENIKYITMDFDAGKNKFLISQVSDEP